VEATAGKVLHIARKQPAARRRQLAPNGVLGMLIFVVAETMFFGGLISAHAIVKAGALKGWPPPGQPRLPVEETLVNTAALIASGMLLYVAQRAFAKNPRAARLPMLLSMLLGAAFVALQGVEWVAMLRQGLTMTSSAHGAFFYLLIGTHGLHVLGGLAVLSWAYWRLMRGVLVGTQLAAVQILWYFVVGLWPVLYWRVYL
jgi:heme/copper-type cytochrome/quinol oxidase subunit 3